MFCFMKRTCLSFTIRPIATERKSRNVLRYQQVYPNKQSLETEGSNSTFIEATKGHPVNLVQALLSWTGFADCIFSRPQSFNGEFIGQFGHTSNW